MFILILTLLGILPALLLMLFIYKKDKREKEPFSLLFSLFLWGCFSCLPALALELLLQVFFDLHLEAESLLYIVLENYLAVALVEEFCKRMVVMNRGFYDPNFNYTFDGIVYSVFASLGFAVLENLMYIFIDGGIGIAILRALTSVPSHAINGVFMGYFLGFAKQKSRRRQNGGNLFLFLSLFVPTLIHGTYDFLLSANSILTILLWFILLIPTYIAAFLFVNKASREDRPTSPVLHHYGADPEQIQSR